MFCFELCSCGGHAFVGRPFLVMFILHDYNILKSMTIVITRTTYVLLII
jgi:hypothetical protein